MCFSKFDLFLIWLSLLWNSSSTGSPRGIAWLWSRGCLWTSGGCSAGSCKHRLASAFPASAILGLICFQAGKTMAKQWYPALAWWEIVVPCCNSFRNPGETGLVVPQAGTVHLEHYGLLPVVTKVSLSFWKLNDFSACCWDVQEQCWKWEEMGISRLQTLFYLHEVPARSAGITPETGGGHWEPVGCVSFVLPFWDPLPGHLWWCFMQPSSCFGVLEISCCMKLIF